MWEKTQIYCRSQVQMERLSFISGSSANEEEDEEEEEEDEEVCTYIQIRQFTILFSELIY